MQIEPASSADYSELITLWEASVRATHDFLAEEDLLMLKPLLFEQFFDAVALHVVRSPSGGALGFSGVAQGKLEMLFIAPQARGLGIGTALLDHARQAQGVTNVDVNEQNPAALAFYRQRGFEVVGRSPLDGLGKHYPLLHMALTRD
ncbi:GNAT family N-acetyltransferase [Vreelandella malpeensis]|uniref:GNAT family N-acetyltransferase n=1 Tax=Vreelandella malpeensis TaxID=1172368 RepID=A0ABS8DNB8_9GAMM|nr:GNAT family N-acetyltransferase [Halomonas malpeensis]MCB8887751.1 GNAT family N-acetyltransferase [Halomonas malpeensis]